MAAFEWIQAIEERRTEWESPPVIVKLTTNPADGDASLADFDLCKLLSSVPKDAKDPNIGRQWAFGQPLYLPSFFATNSAQFRTKHVVPFFVEACRKAGFAVSCSGWQEKKGSLLIQCKRGCIYRGKVRYHIISYAKSHYVKFLFLITYIPIVIPYDIIRYDTIPYHIILTTQNHMVLCDII